jgi:hypothetical protein
MSAGPGDAAARQERDNEEYGREIDAQAPLPSDRQKAVIAALFAGTRHADAAA